MKRKKIINLIIGTNNPGKLREIKDLLPNKLKIYSPNRLKIKSPKENGKTFKENSLIKAKFFSKKSKMICLADDSGLEIDILDKKPGIFSSRWAGSKGNFNTAIKKVFKELSNKDKNWKNKKIKARFICFLSIYWLNGKNISRNGKVEGFISSKKKGKNGFGYDPIFIPTKRKMTFAQMSPSSKFKIDHRSRAFKKIKKFF
ncbi:MAG: RdgB/HAM1 family non-canonical purine NTP pyrophosphatase [Pelagibacterales bacterium]|nr:RdgB/HAM1 family non-canonical purine NTP pyrophosphatase [Pelagibacterales bacterium]